MTIAEAQSPANVTSVFTTYDNTTPMIIEKDVGDTFRVIINYKVIEKTKSFTMLRINFVHLTDTERKF